MAHTAGSLTLHQFANPKQHKAVKPRQYWAWAKQMWKGLRLITIHDGSRWLAHQGEREKARRVEERRSKY